MNKANLDASILSISLDRDSKLSLQKQLLEALRDLVHTGRIRTGARLPSTRNLAEELGVSRVTTTSAYDQLIAEGYLEGRRGSGVYVTSDLPDVPIRDASIFPQEPVKPLPAGKPLTPLGIGYPDLLAFPYREWTRLHDRVWRVPDAGLLGQSDPLGFGPLRTAIAGHLREWRGIQCEAEQIVITSGLVEATELFAKAALKSGDNVLVEEPGHRVLTNALEGCGIIPKAVRVDAQGFNLANAAPGQLNARAVAVTPSRQFPLGVTLSLARRLELLDWTKRQDGFILEDDYDGEFRYQGRPLPAMMSLDSDDRVVYIGSFSKVMFPALRLGYMVVPQRLLPGVQNVLSRIGSRAALIAQPVLAEFIAQGALATHIRRMRRLYSQRQRALCDALIKNAGELITADPAPGGMHLVANLHPKLEAHVRDTDVSLLAKRVDLQVAPLTSFFIGRANQQGLVMGYAAYDAETLESSVSKLANTIRSTLSGL